MTKEPKELSTFQKCIWESVFQIIISRTACAYLAQNPACTPEAGIVYSLFAGFMSDTAARSTTKQSMKVYLAKTDRNFASHSQDHYSIAAGIFDNPPQKYTLSFDEF